jgi:phage gp46-like protein
MSKLTDLRVERGHEGTYDFVIDPTTGDFATTEGLDSAIFVSLFSDRRARADEVPDPLKRRGWIGDLYSDIPDDRIGSGLWMAEQRRLDSETQQFLKSEAIGSLAWFITDGLAKHVDATVAADPARRTARLDVKIQDQMGGTSVKSFELWSATTARTFRK